MAGSARRVGASIVVALGSTLLALAPVSAHADTTLTKVAYNQLSGYPVGTPDTTDPSDVGPPGATDLTGYTLNYETDFTGTTLPAGWYVFTGVPGGDPGGHFGASHVEVADGMLQLNTYRDPQWGNRWVTGGLCQCGLSMKYGAYFVRSRITAAGPNEAELLWPAGKEWPPEIDFNETGGTVSSTSSSVHFGKANNILRSEVNIDMTQWHTWGVIWTPRFILYTVDGRVWGRFDIARDISKVPMTLDLEQRQLCEEGRQCPTAPTALQVNWVAEYSPQ